MKGRKREIKIMQSEFIDWVYSDQEDYAELGAEIVKNFRLYGKDNTERTLDAKFYDLGYLPERLCANPEEFQDYFKDDEMENIDFAQFQVKWV